MADNITLSTNIGSGSVLATDDIAGTHYQIVKFTFGALDSSTIASSGTGTDDAGTQRVTLATDISVPIGDGTDIVSVFGSSGSDGEATTPKPMNTASFNYGYNGSTWDRLRSDITNGLDVDVTRVIPGTSATHLGKAVGVTAGGSDVGVALLAKHEGDTMHVTVTDGDYDVLRTSDFGALHVEPEQHHVIDEMDALTANGGTWAAIDTDTTGVALTTSHVLGLGSIQFDKVDGAANSGIGGITKALTSLNLGGLSPHDILQTVVYVADTTNLDGGSAFFFLRLGTDSTDYNEWRIDGTQFTAGLWETVALEIGDASFAGQGGTGADFSAITYIAVGFSFDAVGDALADIQVDEISFHTNQHVNAAINAEITSSVSSANINLHEVAGSPATKGSGNVGAGSQRITIATDDANLASINTDAGIIAGAVSAGQMQTDVVAALPAGTNLVGDVGVGVRTSGGTTMHKNLDVDESEDAIKAGAGQIYWIHAINTTAAVLYLKLYDASVATVEVGTTVPDLTFPIPTQGDTNGAGFTLSVPNGIAFATAITVAATTGIADNDSGAPGANAVVLNCGIA